MKKTKTLPLLLLFPLAITLISCDPPWPWIQDESYTNSSVFASFDEFVEFYEDKENLEPKENYTFTYGRIVRNDKCDDISFTVKVTRREGISTYEIKNKSGNKITEEEFSKSFSQDLLFESIPRIYEFFIGYCSKIQESGGNIFSIQDERQGTEEVYFSACIYTQKKYNCPALIEIQSYLEEIHINDFDKLFADRYCIKIYDFKLL